MRTGRKDWAMLERHRRPVDTYETFGLLLYTLRGSRRDDGEVRRPDRAGPGASGRGFAPVRSMQPSRYVVVAGAGGPQPAEQPYGLVGDRFVRTSRPYLNDRIRSVGAGRRIGRSSSWPRQWA